MNSSIIRYILGQVLKIAGVLMLLPSLVGLIYQETEGFYYLGIASLCVLIGFIISLKKPADTVIYLKEGCIITALSWILLSIFGALPFYLSGEIPSYTNALFETISGFTTTGASILDNIETLSHASLFWRSFTHWIGGMGVLVFLLAILPMSGGSHMNLMRAESPGPSVGKLVPKVRSTARILYFIYIGLTLLQIILLLLGNMPIFDAITSTFGTAGTGGFAIKGDSIASYSPYIQWVITIFMILFGINFNAYYLILLGQFKKVLRIEELWAYLLIILGATVIIFTQILPLYGTSFEALTHAGFQVASIITTTGFATTDFNLWSPLAKTVLVLLMFIGACAGSTGGGLKVSRLVILIKTWIRELRSYIHPKNISKIKMERRMLDDEVVQSTHVYFITFVILFSLSVLLLSFEGKDLITNFTAVAATFNNIGPGLEMVGPTQNFNHFSILSKYVMMFDMLVGRLELFPMLLLFHPTMWKDMFTRPKKRKVKMKREK